MRRCKYCQTMYSEDDVPEFKPECFEDVEEIDPCAMLLSAVLYLNPYRDAEAVTLIMDIR